MAENSECRKYNSVGEMCMQVTRPVKSPRKQRKQLYTAPAHLRHKFMSAPLSQELASSKGVKSLPVRKGDTVQVIRGDHKGFEGKVNRVDLKRQRIFIEGLTREKVDGTTIFVPVHPSKVILKNLKLDDKRRQEIVERKKLALPKKEKEPKKVEKLPEKAAEVEKEKAVAEPEIAVATEKKPSKKVTEAKPKVARKESAEKKAKSGSTAEEKAPAKRKKKEAAATEEKPVKKETKPEKVKKAPAKRESGVKKGGT